MAYQYYIWQWFELLKKSPDFLAVLIRGPSCEHSFNIPTKMSNTINKKDKINRTVLLKLLWLSFLLLV